MLSPNSEENNDRCDNYRPLRCLLRVSTQIFHESEGTAPAMCACFRQTTEVGLEIDRRLVLCVPGFPKSLEDSDKPFLLNHSRALVEAGFKVTVVAPSLPGLPKRQMVGGIEVLRVRYAPRRLETLAATGAMYREARGLKACLVLPLLFSMLLTLVRELRRGPAVAYGHWWVPGGVVAVVGAWFSKRRSVVHLHGSDTVVAQGSIMRKIARVVLRRADVRLAVSEGLAQWAIDISGREVAILPMPLNFDQLSRRSPVPAEGCLLGVGRLVHEKGFDVLIDAMALLDVADRRPLVIVGIGPDRQMLQARAAQAGISLHLPGEVSPRELAQWYRKASVVVVPSRREGFGLVAAEAAAAGRAVVGSAVGALPTLVHHGRSGLIVEPGNVPALATALREIDPGWGVNGPNIIAHLGFEQHSSVVRQIYDDLDS